MNFLTRKKPKKTQPETTTDENENKNTRTEIRERADELVEGTEDFLSDVDELIEECEGCLIESRLTPDEFQAEYNRLRNIIVSLPVSNLSRENYIRERQELMDKYPEYDYLCTC